MVVADNHCLRNTLKFSKRGDAIVTVQEIKKADADGRITLSISIRKVKNVCLHEGHFGAQGGIGFRPSNGEHFVRHIGSQHMPALTGKMPCEPPCAGGDVQDGRSMR